MKKTKSKASAPRMVALEPPTDRQIELAIRLVTLHERPTARLFVAAEDILVSALRRKERGDIDVISSGRYLQTVWPATSNSFVYGGAMKASGNVGGVST